LKRFGILLVALFIAAVPAIAGPPNITVVNQTGIAVTATLSSSTSQSDALSGTGTWVPPAAPAATYTITFTRPSGPKLHMVKQLTASTQTVYLRHAGQTLQIVLSNDPPTR
jgi:hypothetical protein